MFCHLEATPARGKQVDLYNKIGAAIMFLATADVDCGQKPPNKLLLADHGNNFTIRVRVRTMNDVPGRRSF